MTDKKINRYQVAIPIGATYYETVYATSEEEAKTKVDGYPSLCWQCSDHVEVNEDFDLDEAEVYLQESDVDYEEDDDE